MEIGIGLPNTVAGTEGRTLIDWARLAEEAGFSTLGTIGRLVYPNYEELIALSAAAETAQTNKQSQKKRAGVAAQEEGHTPTMPLSPPVTSVHWKAIDQTICEKASVSIAK